VNDNAVPFQPLTTIILQARDSAELAHNLTMVRRKKLVYVLFEDKNEDAYGEFHPVTAMAVIASPKQVEGILDYLPLWGS
jgi:hypothetical protein